jgi:hypothetical protein
VLGKAREEIMLSYRNYLRHRKLAETTWMNRMAVVSAGIYEDPIQPLNDATSEYLDKLDLITDPEHSKNKKQKSNQELYEEWKALFGKMDD